MEDYEKKYKEALEKANSALKDGGISSNTIAYIKSIFPELKDTEDERIVRKIVAALSYYRNEGNMSQTECNECKLWLKKQGEQKPTLEDAAKAFLEALSETPYNNTPIVEAQIITKQLLIFLSAPKSYNPDAINEQKPVENKGMNLVEEEMTPFQKKVFCIIDTAVEEEQGLKQVCDELLTLASNEIKQKPAEWSEEDERLLSKLQTYVDLECFDRECNGQDLINWLKSLKPQPHWKPSEVQMQQLGWVAKQNETNLIGKELTILYNDLKNLTE